MSKKSKAASKKKRQAAKRARKSARQALYESYRDRGINSKSRRSRLNAKARNKMRSRTHPHGHCGNPGCIKCYGVHYKPFLVKGVPKSMPNWMWMRWSKLSKEEQKKAA